MQSLFRPFLSTLLVKLFYRLKSIRRLITKRIGKLVSSRPSINSFNRLCSNRLSFLYAQKATKPWLKPPSHATHFPSNVEFGDLVNRDPERQIDYSYIISRYFEYVPSISLHH